MAKKKILSKGTTVDPKGIKIFNLWMDKIEALGPYQIEKDLLDMHKQQQDAMQKAFEEQWNYQQLTANHQGAQNYGTGKTASQVHHNATNATANSLAGGTAADIARAQQDALDAIRYAQLTHSGSGGITYGGGGGLGQWYPHPGVRAFLGSWDTEDRPPVEKAETRFGEITAYRMWFARQGYLHSYSQNCLWAPGDVIEGKPGDYNEQGIWAFKTKARAINKMLEDQHARFTGSEPNQVAVWGAVQLWGDVIEHEDGYRAQFAKIIRIEDCAATGPYREQLVEELRKRYKV